MQYTINFKNCKKILRLGNGTENMRKKIRIQSNQIFDMKNK